MSMFVHASTTTINHIFTPKVLSTSPEPQCTHSAISTRASVVKLKKERMLDRKDVLLMLVLSTEAFHPEIFHQRALSSPLKKM